MSTTFHNINDDDEFDDPNGVLEDDLEVGRFVDWVASQQTNLHAGSQSSSSTSPDKYRNCDWNEYQIQHEKLVGELPLSVLAAVASGSSSTSLTSSVEVESGSDYYDEEGSVEWVNCREHSESRKMAGNSAAGQLAPIFLKGKQSPIVKTPAAGPSKKRSQSSSKKSTSRRRKSVSVEKRQKKAPRADEGVEVNRDDTALNAERPPLFPLFNGPSAQSSFNSVDSYTAPSRRSSRISNASTAATSIDGEHGEQSDSLKRTPSEVVRFKQEFEDSASEYEDEDEPDDYDDKTRPRRRPAKAFSANKWDNTKTIRGTVRRFEQQEARSRKAQATVPHPAFKDFTIHRRQTSDSLEGVATPNSTYSVGSTFEQELLDLPMPLKNIFSLPFHKVYEFCRIALSLGYRNAESSFINLGHLYLLEMQYAESSEDFWKILCKIWERSEEKLPQRPLRIVPETWDELQGNSNGRWTNVELSGHARYIACDALYPNSSKYEIAFSLEPLQNQGRSCRFWRRFGSDRFLSISMPSLKYDQLVKLNMKRQEAEEIVFKWAQKGFKLFGRNWKAFYVRDGNKDKTPRIIFFAVKGPGLEPISIPDLVLWHIPIEGNENMSLAKFWARVALGLSSTTPGPSLDTQDDIEYVGDITCRNDAGEAVVMNDGCAAVSPLFFYYIWKQLKLSHCPSAIQGRISGGKGMWYTTPNATPETSERLWAQISKSQHKFVPHQEDKSIETKDPFRLTMDICKISTVQKEAFMNRQLVPILHNNGVPRTAFANIIIAEIQSQIGFLPENIENTLVLRKYLGDRDAEGLSTLGSSWIGSLPRSRVKTAILLIDCGFEISKCLFLKELFMKIVHDHAQSLTSRIHIKVPRSAKAMCIADPTGSLLEGEISMRFTSPIVDGQNGSVINVLRGDVIVTRNPAYLPSDIQKVVAVDRPELSHLQDVVVFSTCGSKPLASYLSGGDYDGDLIWISWEPLLVKPFRNAPEPRQLHNIGSLIELHVTATSLAEFRKGEQITDDAFIEDLWESAMKVALEDNYVGAISTYHECLTYHDGNINSPEAIYLGRLFEHLIDAPKQGKRLRDDVWKQLSQKYNDLPTPAYKAEERPANPPTDHILDYVRFGVAHEAVDKIEKDINQKLRDVPANDVILTALFNKYDKMGRDLSSENSNVAIEYKPEAQRMRAVLRGLEDDLGDLEQRWSERFLSGQKDISPGADAFKQELYDEFRSLQPRPIPGSPFSPVQNWQTALSTDEYSEWALIKASCLYRRKNKGKMVWQLTGKQLCHIKALNCGKPFRVILEDLISNMKMKRTPHTTTDSANGEGDAPEVNDYLMNTQFLQNFDDDMDH